MKITIMIADTADADVIAAFGAKNAAEAALLVAAKYGPIIEQDVIETVVATANNVEQEKLQAVLHAEREAVKVRLGKDK